MEVRSKYESALILDKIEIIESRFIKSVMISLNLFLQLKLQIKMKKYVFG